MLGAPAHHPATAPSKPRPVKSPVQLAQRQFACCPRVFGRARVLASGTRSRPRNARLAASGPLCSQGLAHLEAALHGRREPDAHRDAGVHASRHQGSTCMATCMQLARAGPECCKAARTWTQLCPHAASDFDSSSRRCLGGTWRLRPRRRWHCMALIPPGRHRLQGPPPPESKPSLAEVLRAATATCVAYATEKRPVLHAVKSVRQRSSGVAAAGAAGPAAAEEEEQGASLATGLDGLFDLLIMSNPIFQRVCATVGGRGAGRGVWQACGGAPAVCRAVARVWCPRLLCCPCRSGGCASVPGGCRGLLLCHPSPLPPPPHTSPPMHCVAAGVGQGRP